MFFKTIQLGTGLITSKQFRDALDFNRCVLNSVASDLLDQAVFQVAKGPIRLPLAILSVSELGFGRNIRRDASYPAILDRGLVLGLDLCPPEVGPQLRLQYLDQPLDEHLTLAMKTINDHRGYPRVFSVYRDKVVGPTLGCFLGRESSYYGRGDLMVFALPIGS